MYNKTTVIIVGLVVIAASFYAGMQYGQNQSASVKSARFQQMGANGARNLPGANMRGGGISGEVLSKDDKSIMVKARDGGSKIVFFSNSTVVTQSITGAISDIAVGQQIFVSGSTNSDGSETAQTIQIRPSTVPTK